MGMSIPIFFFFAGCSCFVKFYGLLLFSRLLFFAPLPNPIPLFLYLLAWLDGFVFILQFLVESVRVTVVVGSARVVS